MGQLPSAPPHFFIPSVPFTWETLQIIFPFSLTMAAVGLLESMMTAQIVDDLTDTPSDKAQESKAQGLANFVTGFFGGMGGCAMIGQSVINVKSGGSTRLSTFVAGTFLLFLIVVLGPFVSQIPMPSLVAVMIMVSIGTFSWKSIRDLRTHPWQSSVVMVVTVVVVVWTHDLAQGVAAGVILSGLFFASKVRGLFNVTSTLSSDERTRTYYVSGEVFFASTERFADAFDFKEVLDRVVIDVSKAHFWDISAVGILDKAILKFRREGASVDVIGLNEKSAMMVQRFGEHDKEGAESAAPGH
jgi:SulP family sulfate permease